jgi:hypothetical protein
MTTLEWDEVAERFGAAQNWWVATSGAGGPHTVPVWGVVVDGVLHFYGEPGAVRSRNLAVDPRLVLHLESGSSVLIVHGAVVIGPPVGEVDAVSAAYAAKYTDPTDLDYLPDASGMAAALLFSVTPGRAIAWDLGGADGMANRRWVASS